MKRKFPRALIGLFLLAGAALLVAGQLIGGLRSIGLGSLVLATLALALIGNCYQQKSYRLFPLSAALLYIAFGEALSLPGLPSLALIVAALFLVAALEALFPRRPIDPGARRAKAETGSNFSLSGIFMRENCRLPPGVLESARIQCSFGKIKINFEQVEPKNGAATVYVNCGFGRVRLIMPKHWIIENETNCAIGMLWIGGNASEADENAPRITLTGNVSFGSLEVSRA
ncbi:MAG: hypothetical protein FWE09_06325 [Treponema sp.]|nr:hypothetical protein [Treponema sp.]